MKKSYLTIIAAVTALNIQAQSISPGGIYAAANVNQTPNGSLEWVLGNINSFNMLTTLPVKLIRFEGIVTGERSVTLEWETAEEYNNAGFEVCKSLNARDFNRLGYVEGGGNSKTSQVYQFEDPNLLTTSYYRLTQVDADGTLTYSKVIRVSPPAEQLDRLKAYPNPTKDGKIIVELPERTVMLTMWDVKGRQLLELRRPKTTEVLYVPSSGTFILHIEGVAGQKTYPVIRE